MSLIESNSTKLILSNGAHFQGKPFKPSSNFITIQITASFIGGNSGLLEIYYSIDGIYYDTYGDSWTFTTETNEAHIFKETQIKGSYFYVKWTNNGSSLYTSFNLYSKVTTTTSTVSVDGVINIPEVNVNIDGETVFAKIRDTSGNAITSYDGKLNVIDSDSLSTLNALNNKVPTGLTVNNNKLYVDISGQRVISDISGQTLKVNTISGFALDSTLGTTNTKLDTLNTSINDKHLFFTNDSVTIGDISSGVQVGINNFPSFALDTTLVTTNNKLDTLNTTVTNKHLSKTLDSVDISGQRVITDISGQRVITDISGQRVDISGQRVITDISGQRVDISGQSINVNVISGFALDTTLGTTNTKLDTLNTTITNKHLSKTLDSVDVSGQRVDISGQFVSVSNQISGYALDTTVGSTNTKLDTINTTITNKHLSKTLDSVDVSGQRVDISGQFVSVSNQISGYALDATVGTTNTKLDTLNTTITNKHLSKTLDSVDVSGQRVDISGQRVDISGQSIHVNNFPSSTNSHIQAYDPTLTGYFDVTSTGIGINTSALDVAVKNTVSVNGSVSVSNQISGFMTEITGNDINIAVSKLHSDTTNADAIQVQVKNSSLDTHCYGSSNGSTWHHLATDANGQLNVHAKLQDDAGNALNSTSNALNTYITNSSIPVTGTITANIASNQTVLSNVYDYQHNGITSTNHTAFKYGLDTTSALATTDMTNRYLLTSTSDGGSKRGLDVNIASGSITVSSVNIKDSSGNSIKADASGNLNSALQVYSRTDGFTTNLTSVHPVGASSTKALETYSYMNALTNDTNIPLQLTLTTGISTNSLDCQIQNGSTSNILMDFPTVEKGTGLNMYVIPSKTKTFLFNAYSNNTGANASISSIGNTQTFSAYNWGLANPRNTWSVYRSGTSAFNFYYTYINASGNEIEVTVPIQMTLNATFYPLATGIVTVNSWRTNLPLGTTDTLYICSTSTAGSTALAWGGGNYLIQTNSLWTCPNNCIAWVQNVSFYSTIGEGLRLFKWDVNGVRSIMYGWLNSSNFTASSNGEYGFGGYIKAGETIGWGGENGNAVRNISSNIVCRYL